MNYAELTFSIRLSHPYYFFYLNFLKRGISMKFLSSLLPTFWFLKSIAIVTCVGDSVASLFANF